ncbi:MAG: HlyD family efflux transporter periplasmic adaptor subunit [Eubacteriales bacterium]
MDKRYLSRVLLYLLLALFALALILEIGYQFYDSAYESVEAIDANLTTLSMTEDTFGFLTFEDEQPLYSNTNGSCLYLVSDGEKVSNGQTVAKVYDQTDGTDQQIAELERKIAVLTRAQTLAPSYSTTAVETGIATLRAELTELTAKGEYAALSEVEEELRLMLAISRIATGQVTSYSGAIQEFQTELEGLEASVGNGSAVKITDSGYFYCNVDGYENLLTFSDLSSLTAADCLGLFDAQPAVSPEGSYAVGKLVSGYTWHMICELNPESVASFSEGNSYSVLFGRQKTEVKMTLSQLLVDEDTGRVAALFTSDRQPDGFDFTRMQSVSVVYDTCSGFEIPAGALRIVDGIPGVYVLHGSVVQFREICSVYSGDGYVFSLAEFESDSGKTALSRYDRIIVKGKDLYVGKIIS